jgi:hypothetical protein
VERVPRPKDLRGAANVARALAYVVGLVGVVGGVIVQRGGNTPLALAIWVVTFAGGAVLMIAGFLCDGLAALLGRTAAIEQQLATLRRPPPSAPDPDDEWRGHPNPW